MAGADSSSTLSKLSVSVLDPDEETATPSTVGDFRDGKRLILDFWHTRCVKCPAALTWLDAQAEAHPDITFASCALSLGSDTEGTQEQVLELLEGQWENLKHLYMSLEDKEAAKAALGFKAVPFCVALGADGAIVYQGDPHGIDFKTVFDTPPAAEDNIADGLSSCSIKEAAAPAKPLAEANREMVSLGFGNDDEDF
jgi:thiol-disulfide isomerase/thioredoxin